MEEIGVNAEEVSERVEELRPRGDEAPSGSPPFTPEAKKTLELSLREALQLGHDYIGTEHILLVLSEQEREWVPRFSPTGRGIDHSQVSRQDHDSLDGLRAHKACPGNSGGANHVRQVEGETVRLFPEKSAEGRGLGVTPEPVERLPTTKLLTRVLKNMFESIGVDLLDDDFANIVVTPVITNEGPGSLMSVWAI